MRQNGAAYAAGLYIAHERAERERRAADAWRRRHTSADDEAEVDEAAPTGGLRAAIAHVVGALSVRRTRPLA